MIRKIRRLVGAFLCLSITVCGFCDTSFAEGNGVNTENAVNTEENENRLPFDLDCESAVLMDFDTGTVLYEKEPDKKLPPASVTKVMTLLLVMEAVDSGKIALDDKMHVSDYAASMGGSQVYLEPGEEMSVEDLIKSVVVSSANDAAVTLAEGVAGSESEFIARMNERASQLGMVNTCFENATGLDDTAQNHLTSARDIAIMSRELMKHSKIFDYTTIWMDTIRNGAFTLSNTNRLIRFYSGATGLKTGSTSKAKFCISATAKRDGLHLIAVIMGAPSRDVRNDAAKKLLDHGFANYSVYTDDASSCSEVRVAGGKCPSCSVESKGVTLLLGKGESEKVTVKRTLPKSVDAPVKKGSVVGKVTYYVGEREVGHSDITASEDVKRIDFFGLLAKMIGFFSLS